MTEKELQIAVCKELGWRKTLAKGISAFDAACYGGVPNVWYFEGKEYDELPPLTLDLCHEAEKTLTCAQWPEYCKRTEKLAYANKQTLPCDWKNVSPSFIIDVCLIHAATIQRATAFIAVKKGI